MPVSSSTTSGSLAAETTLSKRLATIVACAAVSLTVGIFGCDDLVTEQTTIVIAGNPSADFSVLSDSGCAPMTVVFSDKSDGPHDQWLWRFGDGDSSTDTTPTHTYTQPGTYDVSLKITDNIPSEPGSDREFKKRFIVVGTSIGGFAMDSSSGCVGLVVKFTPSFGAASTFSWKFGDGTTSSDTMPTHKFNVIGDFPVTLAVTGPCGVDTTVDTVHIGVCPTFTFFANQTNSCAGAPIIFTEVPTDTVSHVNRTWDFGDGVILSDLTNTISHTYTDTGLFTVRLTVDNTDGASFTDSIVDYIHIADSLTADFTASTTFACKTAGQFIVTFTDISKGVIDNRIWNFGDGILDTSNNPSPSHHYITPGQYNVTLEVFGACAALPSVKNTGINFITLAGAITPGISTPLDNIDTAGAGTITYNFKDISLGVPSTWLWTFGDGQTSTESEVKHTYPLTAMTYQISLTVGNTCSNTNVVITDSIVVVP